MYGVRLHNNKFILIGKSFERELSQEQLEHLADDGATVLIDLDADGLMFIFEYFLEKLDSLKIVSYGLTIKKIHYKRLQVKNSALFGVGGDNITWGALEELGHFVWKYSQRTLRDSRIISLASVASMFIEARGGYLNSSITTDMLNFIELAYHGGRLEVLKPGYWGTVGYYDFKLMYGSLLLEALPVSLRWAHLPDITSQGFYDITFTGGGASAASVLPIRGPSVTYAKEGRGVYWSEEIMYFIKSGGKVVNTHLGLEVNVAAPFLRKVSESLIADRASGCRFAKLTLNSAYGRFAARHSSEPDRLANITREDAHTYAGAGSCLKYKSLYLIRGEGVTAKRASRGNIAAAAAITAKARVRLNELVYELECAGGVIICLDTDCVVFSGCLKLINDRGYKRRDDYAVITARAQTWGREY